jgi:hypothetical protein
MPIYARIGISRHESSVTGHESFNFVTGLCFSVRFIRFPLLITILPLLQHIYFPPKLCYDMIIFVFMLGGGGVILNQHTDDYTVIALH